MSKIHIHIHTQDESLVNWSKLSWEQLYELERQGAFNSPTIRTMIPETANNKYKKWKKDWPGQDSCSCKK
jgi:hypothetical protein